MRRIQLEQHLSIDEIERNYRHARDGVERSQWQIIWLLAQGKGSKEVQAVTCYSLDWIRTIARHYNAEGAAGIGDRRHQNPGRPTPLTPQQQQALKIELTQAQARGKGWSGPQVAQWMSEQLGRRVYMQRGYEWLAKLGFSPQLPRPQHIQANLEDQRVFKKSFLKP
jgi:transposase